MQIPTDVAKIGYGSCFSVGLATIGVCVFCAAYFGSRTFYFIFGGKYGTKEQTVKKRTNNF